ncbi:MAG: NAAT family transporter [Chlamydiia bacterium]|nr:NAAT family transporter [Chlamydiia bacterium]
MTKYALFSIAFSLFLLMDPIGNIPIYIATLKDVRPSRQRKIIVRELFIALAVIILFTFIGEHLLDLLGVSQPTVLIAGGIILFIIALKMIFPHGKEGAYESPARGEPLIVPLAIPLVAGPSVLAAVMIYSHRVSLPLLIGAIIIAWAVSTLILLSASYLKKILGVRGITACERLMGLLLTLLSVQMLLEGLSLYLAT